MPQPEEHWIQFIRPLQGEVFWGVYSTVPAPVAVLLKIAVRLLLSAAEGQLAVSAPLVAEYTQAG
ncbi:MAG: hypothetical protein C0498_14180 [Anaerolinea sp.]|nr:hypothetical protein [Anaerolinea sp.]